MTTGLVQRRRGNAGASASGSSVHGGDSTISQGSGAPGGPMHFESSSATSPDEDVDLFDDGNDLDANKRIKLTLLEEVVLLGLKDEEGYLSWWNDNISYVLRGCILLELSFRGRIDTTKDSRRRAFPERCIEVIDRTPTGDVLLDEATRHILSETASIADWMDYLSGETWHLLRMGYQLKQVRERVQKSLVDKGVLRTSRTGFLLFDTATHPLSDRAAKQLVITRLVDCLMRRTIRPDRRTIALVCAAYAANVLENALAHLPSSHKDACFLRADEILDEYGRIGDRPLAGSAPGSEIMAGVLSVFGRMDSLL
ncbi:hypothetical protein H696_01705 [Fonticula alba]|uniref:Golgi phosphoprotein 3 n=1 Tax=Fonticula alba TaxID=691883 RepID=A0A058ZD46_FONAL|nr:hypothetical protein H696_01705 [Fonticula alba]KCV72309.1 hypothetical protein H696_01705 [Fonticula alba]|eukprot:XP_009493887.1 hypothetical protein H696_01705 [Fonticula alba]